MTGSHIGLTPFFPPLLPSPLQELHSQREMEVLVSEYNATLTELRDRLAAVAQIPGTGRDFFFVGRRVWYPPTVKPLGASQIPGKVVDVASPLRRTDPR